MGAITAAVGTLKLGANNALCTTAQLNVGQAASTAVFDMNGYNQTFTGLFGLNCTSGTITNTGSSSVTLTTNPSSTLSLDYATITDDGTHALNLVISGSSVQELLTANTYSGTTTITSGTLRLGASGVVPNTSNVTMNGGTFSTGSSSGYNETVGTLTLNASSIIALGTGSHSLNFAASNGTSWTGAATLTITGWQGSWNSTSGTSGKIYTGSSAELSAGKLSQIRFLNSGTGSYHTATQLSDGEIVPTSVLPVTFLMFTSNKTTEGNMLVWKTAHEENNAYFIIQRSYDGFDFEQVEIVKGAGTTNALTEYMYLDSSSSSLLTTYYRLKQVDFDGKFEYSNIVYLRGDKVDFKDFYLYPNPLQSGETLHACLGDEDIIKVSIFDMSGNLIESFLKDDIYGNNNISFEENKLRLNKGFYIFEIQTIHNDYKQKLQVR